MGRLDERIAARAVPAAAAQAPAPGAAEPPPDEGAPIGPAPEEESVILATQRESAPAIAAPAPRPEPPAKLPPLDELVARIPHAVREALDDLFRAKFTTVRQVPLSALK